MELDLQRIKIAATIVSGMLAHPTRYKNRPQDSDLTFHQAIVKEAYEITDELFNQQSIEINKESLESVIEDSEFETKIRLEFLNLPFKLRKVIGEKLIKDSFSGINISEYQRSINFLIKIKQEKRYPEFIYEMKALESLKDYYK